MQFDQRLGILLVIGLSPLDDPAFAVSLSPSIQKWAAIHGDGLVQSIFIAAEHGLIKCTHLPGRLVFVEAEIVSTGGSVPVRIPRFFAERPAQRAQRCLPASRRPRDGYGR